MLRSVSLVVIAVAVLAPTSGTARPTGTALERVTVIGDSIATSMAADPAARPILSRGIDIDFQLAVCRRLVGDSCPYQGTRPPTLVALLPSIRLGSTVVVAVGYNDYEDSFPASVQAALQALDDAGAKRILWLTLRAERQSYLHMNDIIRAAAARHPEVTVVDWNLYSRSHPEWFQPDGLHLDDVGAIAMATLIHRTLDDLGLVVAPPKIVTRRLPPARVGRAYATRLRAAGGSAPIRWASTSGALPAGLHLRPDGRVSGTPRTAGRRVVTVRASDTSGGSATHRFAIVIAPR